MCDCFIRVLGVLSQAVFFFFVVFFFCMYIMQLDVLIVFIT